MNSAACRWGPQQTQTITMSASGAAVTVSSDSSSNSQFVLEGAAFPLTIAAGSSVTFNVAFTPTSSGAESGTLAFASNANSSSAAESLTRDWNRNHVQRQSLVECQQRRCWLQHLPQHQRHRHVCQNQSQRGRKYGLYRQHSSFRSDLLLRGHVSKFQRTGECALNAARSGGCALVRCYRLTGRGELKRVRIGKFGFLSEASGLSFCFLFYLLGP